MPLSVGELLAYLKLEDAGFTAGIAKAREGMAGATGSAERMAGAVGMTETALANAGRQAGVASAGTAKYRAAQLSAVAATERYNLVLADENATIRQLALAEAALIRANQAVKASTPVASIAATGTAAEVTAGRMARLRASMASGAATVGKLGLAFGAFELARKALDITRQASDFNASMVRVQTQAGATAAEVRGFTGDVLGLSGKVAQSPDDLATSLYHVYSATKALGYTAPQMLDAVRTAAEGATVSGVDLEETTNALTATMVSGLGSVNNMGKAMGALNAIVGAGDMKLSDLNDALGTGILAAVKVYGVTLAQAGAALAVFGDNNIRGSDAATKLRMSIQDLSKPAATAGEVLGRVGLSVTDLRDDLQQGGLSLALHDLKDRLQAAGITGDRVGGFLQDAFTKKAGVGLAILLNNLDQYDQKQKQITHGAGGFGAAWSATTKTASFAFKSLGAEAEAQGIILTQKLLPAATHVATFFAGALTASIKAGHDVLVPFAGAWHVLAATLMAAGHAVADIAHFLEPISPVVKFLATDVLAMWAAFKGYQIARFAMNAIADGIATVQARSVAGLASARAYGTGVQATLAGNATEAQLASRIMQAEFAQTAAAAEAEAAAVATAAADQATAWAALVAASDTATASMIAGSEGMAAAAQAAAATAAASAAEIAASAEAAAAAVDEAGAVASVGWKAMLGPLAAVGVGIALLTTMFGGNSAAAAENARNVEDLTSALQQDNSVVGESTKSWIAHKLVTDGVFDNLAHLGLSYETVTSAVMGNKGALAQVNRALTANLGHLWNGGKGAVAAAQKINSLAASLDQARARTRELDAAQVALKQPQRDAAAAASRNADAVGNLAAGSHDAAVGARANADATDGEAESVKKAESANKAYTQSLRAELSAMEAVIQARLGQATSEDQFLESVRGVTQALKGHRDSLSQDSKAGLENRDAFLSSVSAALSLKDAQDKAGGSTAAHTRQLASNIGALRDAAVAAGADRGEVDKLLRSIGAFPADIRSKVTLDTGPARQTLVDLMNQINSLHPEIHVGISGGHTLPGQASGGGLPEGVSAVGERGAELAIKNGSSVQILSHGQSRSFLAATGMRAPGFASGTDPGPITTSTSAGHKVWIYNGIRYASLAAAQNAETRDQQDRPKKALSAAQSALSGIQVSILAPNPTALRQFLEAADAAAKKITAAAAAGVSPKKLAQLRGDLADMVKTANRQLGNLRVQINHADMRDLTRSLSGSASDVRGAWQSIVTDLRDAGLGRHAISALSRTERALASHVGRRDRLQDALAAARQARAEERSTVSGAVSGFFNVTSAGASPVSGAVSFGSLRAQQLQAKNQIVKWASGIRKLRKMFGKSRIGIEYLRSLAEAGPSTLPQVEALLSGGESGLHAIIDTQRTIDKTAASIGGLVGSAVDQPRIDRLKDALDHQNKVIDKLDGKIEKGIKDGLHGLRIEVDDRGFAKLVTAGHNKNKRAT